MLVKPEVGNLPKCQHRDVHVAPFAHQERRAIPSGSSSKVGKRGRKLCSWRLYISVWTVRSVRNIRAAMVRREQLCLIEPNPLQTHTLRTLILYPSIWYPGTKPEYNPNFQFRQTFLMEDIPYSLWKLMVPAGSRTGSESEKK